MNAIQTEVSDGTLQTIQVGLRYIEQNDISVYLGNGSVPLVAGTDYNWVSATAITFVGPPKAPGVVVTLRRMTDSEQLLNVYDGGAPFTRATLDENFRQLLQLAQEFTEGIGLTQLGQNLNLNGWRVVNMANPVDDQDAVTLVYLKATIDALIASGQAPVVTAANTQYALPNNSGIGNLQQLSGSLGAQLIGYGSGTLYTEVQTLRQAIVDLNTSLNSVAATAGSASTAATQANQAIAALTGRVANAETDIIALKARPNGLGDGQTMQEFTGGTRVKNTNYTNTTGRSIMLYISWNQEASNSCFVWLNDVNVARGLQAGITGGNTITLLVPAGAVYRVTGDNSILRWMELR